MGCLTTSNTVTNNENRSSIYSLLKRIDQLQKDVILNNLRNGCENCSLGSLNNTKPISIYNSVGMFSASLDAANTTSTTLFRIEEVSGETVVLRLLQITDGVITCTDFTIVYNIDCICAVQCFDAINCERCGN